MLAKYPIKESTKSREFADVGDDVMCYGENCNTKPKLEKKKNLVNETVSLKARRMF